MEHLGVCIVHKGPLSLWWVALDLELRFSSTECLPDFIPSHKLPLQLHNAKTESKKSIIAKRVFQNLRPPNGFLSKTQIQGFKDKQTRCFQNFVLSYVLFIIHSDPLHPSTSPPSCSHSQSRVLTSTMLMFLLRMISSLLLQFLNGVIACLTVCCYSFLTITSQLRLPMTLSFLLFL